MSGLRIFGLIVALVGVFASLFPDGFSAITGSAGPEPDVFEAIERRVRGGMVLGIGLAFIGVTAMRPWSTSIPSAVFYLMTGALAARIVGMLIEGVVPRQWLLIAVEALILMLIALWLGYKS